MCGREGESSERAATRLCGILNASRAFSKYGQSKRWSTVRGTSRRQCGHEGGMMY